MIKQIYQREQFNPRFMGLFINPFYFARRGLYSPIKNLGGYISGKTLDVGCGKKPYKDLFNSSEYIGMDIKNPGHNHKNEKVDIYYDGKNYTFQKQYI